MATWNYSLFGPKILILGQKCWWHQKYADNSKNLLDFMKVLIEC